MSEEATPSDTAKSRLAAALAGVQDWLPQTPLDYAMIASGFIPGRLGKAALAGTTGAAVMSPRPAHGEPTALSKGGMSPDLLRDLARAFR